MGSDLTVVNSARVSYANAKDIMDKKDEKLLAFLAREGHWSPFAHCFIQFRISAPIFVARQLVKHQVGLSWNEVSRRYVDFEPEIYMPEHWRSKGGNSKQGSLQDTFIEVDNKIIENHLKEAVFLYERLLSEGVCAEQARMVLPQNMMTQWYWSGSLMAFARVCQQRCAADTQKETRDVANKINELCVSLFPVSWKELTK